MFEGFYASRPIFSISWGTASEDGKEDTATVRIEIGRSGSCRNDPRVTFAKATYQDDEFGRFVGTGASHCDDHDDFDFETGDLLAIGRALQDLSRQVRREGWARVYRS